MVLCGLALFTVSRCSSCVPLASGRAACGVVVRVVLLPIFGLGGLALGALLVLIAFPSVPLDASGARRDLGRPPGRARRVPRLQPPRSRAGLAGAAAGAMLGAWLGFGCAAAPLALLTAVVGAVAGANLMLLVTDYAWIERAALTT